jgi:hypothetical protein
MLKGVNSKYWAAVKPLWDRISLDDDYETYKNKLKEFSKIQIDIFASQIMYSEVIRGGFFQFYYNASGIVIYEAVEGFKALGMKDTADIVQKSINYYDGKDLTDRDIRVSDYKTDINDLDELFRESSNMECGGYDSAATNYLMENLAELDNESINMIKSEENVVIENDNKTNINWEELDSTFSIKEKTEYGYSLRITKDGLANLMESFIGKDIIKSAIDEYDKKPYGIPMASEFIKHLHSDFCVNYTFEKFQNAQDPFIKSSLASLLGSIENKKILDYYDVLLTNENHRINFLYILHNLINEEIVKPSEIIDKINALEKIDTKAYNDLMEVIKKKGYDDKFRLIK